MTGTFAIIAWDVPDSAGLRAEHRTAHFARIETIADRLRLAGPLRDDSGNNIGSLVIIAADSRADALAVFEADPYFAAGVWERWEIHPFLPAAGDWIGGAVWGGQPAAQSPATR